MTRKYSVKIAGLLLVFALVAAACSSDDDSSDTTQGDTSTTATTSAPVAVPGLVEEGKLIVVTTGNFPPFTLINENSGDNEGYSIDLAREVATRLGLELELPTVDFVAELEGLASGLYDIADSGIWPNEARQEAGFVFSRPMTSTGIIAQVRAEDEGSAGFANVTGLKIGGIQGSSQEKFVLDNEAELGYDEYLGFQGAAEALTGLRQGRVDLLVQDTLVAGFVAVQNDDLAVAGPTILAHPLSFTYQNGNEAKRDAIDVAINEMLADGTVAQLQNKWFGRCIPVPDDINQAEPYTTLPGGECPTTSGDVSAGPAAVPGLVEEGKLIVVTTGNFPPFTLINEDSGDNEGYSIDLAREVATRLGLELELPTVDFVAELEGLASGLYDIADSGIWPNEARQEAGFVFSRPMTSTGIIAQVRAEDEGSAGFANVTGLKIGGIQGSSQEKFVLDNEAELGYDEYLGFQGAAEALTGLRQGRVDLLVQDTLVAGFVAVQNDDLAVAGPTILAHPLSFTYQNGNEAKRDAIDVAINEMLADGTVAQLQNKWFGRCIPVPDDINQAEPYTTLPGGTC